jgi:hypothetical protein
MIYRPTDATPKRLPRGSKLFVEPVQHSLIEQRSILHRAATVGTFLGGEVHQRLRAAQRLHECAAPRRERVVLCHSDQCWTPDAVGVPLHCKQLGRSEVGTQIVHAMHPEAALDNLPVQLAITPNTGVEALDERLVQREPTAARAACQSSVRCWELTPIGSTTTMGGLLPVRFLAGMHGNWTFVRRPDLVESGPAGIGLQSRRAAICSCRGYLQTISPSACRRMKLVSSRCSERRPTALSASRSRAACMRPSCSFAIGRSARDSGTEMRR